jgi:hypothetical protein
MLLASIKLSARQTDELSGCDIKPKTQEIPGANVSGNIFLTSHSY